MSDPQLREFTASEELTLEEEYTMQTSWQLDQDKLTFIVVPGHFNWADAEKEMVGDVNLFLSLHHEDSESGDEDTTRRDDDDDYDDGVDQGKKGREETVVGELEVMIANERDRRKGYARSALLMFMAYILTHSSQITSPFEKELTRFQVKVGSTNSSSIRLFESIGFQKVKFVEYFQEWELWFEVADDAMQRVLKMMTEEDRDWKEVKV